MADAWTRERVHDEYNVLRMSFDAKAEQLIRDMARDAVDANAGIPRLGTTIISSGRYLFNVHARSGNYRNIIVRLIPDMERAEALEIAERQIREQWIEQPQEIT